MESDSDQSDARDSKNDKSKSKNNKLFITNLDGSANQKELEDQLRQLFKQYGNIKSLVVKKSRNSQYCFGFIQYQPDEDAMDAITHLDQTEIGGKKIKVQYQDNAKRRKDSNKGCYTCGKMGHFARQCRSKNDSRGFRGRSHSRSRSRSRSDDSEPRKKHKKRHHSDSSDRSRTPKHKKCKAKGINNDRKEKSIEIPRLEEKKEEQKKTQILILRLKENDGIKFRKSEILILQWKQKIIKKEFGRKLFIKDRSQQYFFFLKFSSSLFP